MRLSAFAFATLVWAPGAVAGCLVDAPAVDFGIIDPFEGETTVTDVAVDCDTAATFQIGLSAGTSGNPSLRQMLGPSPELLSYMLTLDAGFGTPWGDFANGGTPIIGQSDGQTPLKVPVYGIVLPGQSVPEGTYVDQLEMEIRF